MECERIEITGYSRDIDRGRNITLASRESLPVHVIVDRRSGTTRDNARTMAGSDLHVIVHINVNINEYIDM